MHDRRVEARPDALGEENGVQHRARGRVQAERHVGDAQRGLHFRVAALELADRLDRLDRVPPGLLLAGRYREGQAVHDDVGQPDAPVAGQVLDQPGRHRQLPRGGAGLALLVDGERDHGGAVLAHQRHHPGEPRARAVAVLVVDRVDHRAAAEQFQAGLDHLRLGGVEHQRQRGRGGQPADDLAHVAGAVPADVVDVHVQQVRAVPGLRPGDLHAVVVAAGDHRIAESPGPVRVGPLADRQERGVLPERHVLVERRDAGLGARSAPGQRPVPQPGDDGGQVPGRGPAAAARQREPELGGEHLMGVGELIGGHRVVRAI